MKIKKSLFAIVALPMFLVSCQGSVANLQLPNDGKTIQNAQGKEELINAIGATVQATSTDALGISIEDSSISFDLHNDFSTTDKKTIANTNISLGLNNFYYKTGAEGLFSPRPEDLKLYTQLGGATHANLLSKLTDHGKELNFLIPEFDINLDGNYAFGSYIQDKNVYVDLSNDDLYNDIANFANTLMKLMHPNSNYDFATKYPDRKVYFSPCWDYDEFPIMDDETFTQELLDEFDSLPQSGTYRDHGNGVYSYSGNVPLHEMDDVFEELIDNDILGNEYFKGGNFLDNIFEGNHFDFNLFDEDLLEDAFDDIVFSNKSSMEYAAVFNQHGIDSLAFTGVVEGTTRNRFDSYSIPVYNTITTKASFNFKVNFTYGTDVSFPVIDTTEYKPAK